MRRLINYLILTLVIIFWISRVAICMCYMTGQEIGVNPLDFNREVVYLFVTLLLMVFVIKKKMLGAIFLFVANGLYFGEFIYSGIIDSSIRVKDRLSFVLACIGLVLSFLTIIGILIVKKERNGNVKDEKTDWFFLNKNFDRKHDERADENQYKF